MPQPIRIAVQGVAGCFSEEAAHILRPHAEVICRRSFADIFTALAAGEVERGLIPFENTLAGPISEAQELLRQNPVRVDDEVRLRIVHCLMMYPTSSVTQVKRILSHWAALQQCGHFLSRHPQWKVVPFFDTAGSVEEIMRSRMTDAAAIASARSAEVYGAKLEQRDIGDQSNNFTRFFLIAAT